MVKDNAEERLNHLLEEEFAQAQARAETFYDLTTGAFGDRIVLFGAGRFARSMDRKLRALGIQPIAFADNNIALWGTKIDGVEIVSPKDAAMAYGKHATFVVFIWNGEAHDRMADRVRQLRSLGCEVVIPFASLFWKHNQAFLPHY